MKSISIIYCFTIQRTRKKFFMIGALLLNRCQCFSNSSTAIHSYAFLIVCAVTHYDDPFFQNYRADDAFVGLRLWPNNSGRYGFHVEVTDGSVVVSRVVEGTPADTSAPRLCEGDRLVTVNGVPMDGVDRAEVVRLIREHGRVPCVPMSLIVRPKGEFSCSFHLYDSTY